MSNVQSEPLDNVEPLIPLGTAIFILFAVFVGAVVGVFVIPTWLPGLAASLFGPNPKAYWDLARTSAITGYVLFWISVMLGLLITNRMARVWPGGPTAIDLHQFTSLLGLAFALFHGLILMGDSYMNFSPLQILIPFTTFNYRPLSVGLGQIAFFMLIPITFSFYLRKQLGPKTWRALHYGTFIAYSLITVHGLLSGSDTTAPLILGLYAVSGALVYFLTVLRILNYRAAQA